MKRIEAIIRPTRVGKVCAALEKVGQFAPRISQLENRSRKDTGYLLRGITYKADLAIRARVEVIINDGEIERIVKAVREAACTGDPGDGEIFVHSVENAIRISTGEGC
jgi:nitrogen regulatory protein P-II 1